MPLYSYTCKQCNKQSTAYRKVVDRHNAPECCEKMQLKIVPTLQYVDHMRDGYKDIVTGEYVDSRKRRREIMKEHNLIERG